MSKIFHYNGMTYEYDENTRFIIQTGRYKNTYKTRIVRTGSMAFALHCDIISDYEIIHVASGYKKRLLMIHDIHDSKETIIARFISER